MASYTVNEPHPTVPQNSYTHSGRGGAGNTFRVSTATTSSSGIPSKVTTTTPSTGRFYSGRGGAGNVHAASERHVLSFEEEYAEAARHAQASTGHVGRGGAGNVFGGDKITHSSRRGSASTSGSERSGFFGRLSLGSRQ